MRHVVYHNVHQKDFVQNNIWHHKGFVGYKKIAWDNNNEQECFIE
jgi:hypothetical protein